VSEATPVLLGGDGQPLNAVAAEAPPPGSPAILRKQWGPGGATGWFSDDPANDTLGRDILNDLHQAYPHHRWWVRIDGGIVVVYNYLISGKWGMVHQLNDIMHDATKRRRDVQRAAGELLERASLRRRANDGMQGVEALEIQRFGKTTVKAGIPI